MEEEILLLEDQNSKFIKVRVFPLQSGCTRWKGRPAGNSQEWGFVSFSLERQRMFNYLNPPDSLVIFQMLDVRISHAPIPAQ